MEYLQKPVMILQSSTSPKWMPYLSLTASDRVLSKVYRHVKTGWPDKVSDNLGPYHNRRHELMVEEGCVMWGIRVTIPEKLRYKLLYDLHTDHPGTTHEVYSMWWPGLDTDIGKSLSILHGC